MGIGKILNVLIGGAITYAGWFLYSDYMPSYYSSNISFDTVDIVFRNMQFLTYGSYALMAIGAIIILWNLLEVFE